MDEELAREWIAMIRGIADEMEQVLDRFGDLGADYTPSTGMVTPGVLETRQTVNWQSSGDVDAQMRIVTASMRRGMVPVKLIKDGREFIVHDIEELIACVQPASV